VCRCGSNSVDVKVVVAVFENSTTGFGGVVLRKRGQVMVERRPGNWRLRRGGSNGELTPRPLYVFDLKEVGKSTTEIHSSPFAVLR
jgi:hypothetical protein